MRGLLHRLLRAGSRATSRLRSLASRGSTLRLGLGLGLAALWASARPAWPAERAEPRRPNVVLFLVDDMGWTDSSVVFGDAPTANHELYRTPTMERLAREGMRFSEAYASSPVCSPTRTAILTGRAPARTRITNWIPGRGEHGPADHLHRLPDWRVDGLGSGDVTLPRVLGELGYVTAHVGKAHFGREGTEGADPLRLGFDHNIAGTHRGGPGSYLAPYTNRAGRFGVPDLEEFHERGTYLTDALAEKATALVERLVLERRDRPFFLHFAPYALHAPIEGHPERAKDYAGRGLPKARVEYASMVASMDAALGAVLRTLDRLEVADDTLVIFASDNGGLVSHSGPPTTNAPLASGKGSSREGGIRVPLIVRWPGVARPGSRCAVPVISHDLFATILAAARAPEDIWAETRVDGRDLGPLLRGDDGFRPRDLVWHYPHYWGWKGLRDADPTIRPFSALRRDRWKLVWSYDEQRAALFDLAADSGETRDLVVSRPEVADELTRALGRALRDVDAQTPIRRADGEPLLLPGSTASGPRDP